MIGRVFRQHGQLGSVRREDGSIRLGGVHTLILEKPADSTGMRARSSFQPLTTSRTSHRLHSVAAGVRHLSASSRGLPCPPTNQMPLCVLDTARRSISVLRTSQSPFFLDCNGMVMGLDGAKQISSSRLGSFLPAGHGRYLTFPQWPYHGTCMSAVFDIAVGTVM